MCDTARRLQADRRAAQAELITALREGPGVVVFENAFADDVVTQRDYHLGFVNPDDLAAYPAHMHRMSAALTLQGAVAHCDVLLESGPTMLPPHSQRFAGGYIAVNRREFIEFFAAQYVQTRPHKGDAVFFNPALYHRAGTKTSADIPRMANLLHVSSPFGRAVESLERGAMARAVYPELLSLKASGMQPEHLVNAVVATAEGYPFPTNLDRDQPIGSVAPPSLLDTVLAALAAGDNLQQLYAALREQDDRRTP